MKRILYTLGLILLCVLLNACADEGAHTHSVIIELEGKAPTCTQSGKSASSYCAECGLYVSKPEELPPSHRFAEATCSAPSTCLDCGETTGTKAEHVYEGGVCTLCGIQKAAVRTDAVIVNMGDSIFGNTYDETSVSSYIGAYTGASVYNCAFGGTRMIARDETASGYYLFDFENLLEAIISDDFSAQRNAIETHRLPERFLLMINTLENIDWASVSIITLNYGTNDYTASVGIDNYQNGAYTSLSRFMRAFPHIQFVLLSPTWRGFLDDEGNIKETGDTRIIGGATCQDYVNASKEIAESLHIAWIDLYHIGINEYNYTSYFPANDLTHQNAVGREKLGRMIAWHLMAY